MAAAFACTTRPPISLRSEMRIASSTKVSLSTRQMFSVGGLRTRVSLSSVSKNSSASRLRRRGGIIICEAQDTATGIPMVNDSTWESLVLKADEPVVVDFWAPWCGPCKMIDPIVNELAQQYTGKIKFFKLNTDDSPATPGKYGVRSIPTIMIFVKGEKKDTIIDIKSYLDMALGSAVSPNGSQPILLSVSPPYRRRPSRRKTETSKDGIKTLRWTATIVATLTFVIYYICTKLYISSAPDLSIAGFIKTAVFTVCMLCNTVPMIFSVEAIVHLTRPEHTSGFGFKVEAKIGALALVTLLKRLRDLINLDMALVGGIKTLKWTVKIVLTLTIVIYYTCTKLYISSAPGLSITGFVKTAVFTVFTKVVAVAESIKRQTPPCMIHWYTRGSNINIERSNFSTMEKGVPLELTRGSANWARVVEEIVKLEKKTFPKHESLAQTFDGELRKRNAGLLYVAVDGETLGYVMYAWPSSLSASITKLAVKESCRRQGHGEALLRAAIEKCRSRKVQRVSLHVDPTRIAAVNLYKKHGFQVDCLVKSYYSADRDAYRMYLDFDDSV